MAAHTKHQNKAKAGKRSVDLGDDQVQNRFPFGWLSSYNQRALCVRILIPWEEKKHSISIPKILSVKFITADETSNEGLGYPCLGPVAPPMSIDHFNGFLSRNVESFEHSETASDYWKGISKLIEISNYRYENLGKVDQWTTTPSITDEELQEEIDQASLEQGRYVASFGAAMKGDMKNGLGQMWMSQLIDNLLHIIEDITVSEVLCFGTSSHCSSSPEIELIYGDEDEQITQTQFNAPHSNIPVGTLNQLSLYDSLPLSSVSEASERSSVTSDMSEGSSYKVKKRSVVPDFCAVFKHFPGVFPLVVELIPARQETRAIFQNVQHMLSKMFFQDVVFGMVVSPRSFQMSVIIKKDGGLRFASTNAISLMNPLEDNKLCMENLNLMCTFVYRVLTWSTKTLCSLEN